MDDFSKHRPASHFLAPSCWMNDPCGLIYVPEAQEYILCYQWNPGSSDPGNGAWGTARSKDLVTWYDCMPALQCGTGHDYDAVGVFSGSIVSRMVEGQRKLYLFYTSVAALPIHWSTPYLHGCESQSVAISSDLGQSWQRHMGNPLLTAPPHYDRTTGWRDPYVSEWSSLSTLRGVDQRTNYMMIASGKMDVGCQLMIYESKDLLQWTKLSDLLQVKADTPIGSGSNMLWGRNFECASFCNINGRDYIIAGIEEDPDLSRRHASRYVLWMSGSLCMDSHGVASFDVLKFGYLDHGISYAPHIFTSTEGDQLHLGWADEDDNEMTKEQGWAGCLVHPRRLFQLEVSKPDVLPVQLNHWTIDDLSQKMTTLGISPASQVEKLRQGSRVHNLNSLSSIQSINFEIDAKFVFLSGTEKLTFNVRQAPYDKEVTRIIFHLSANTITINRRASSLTNGNPKPDSGKFELLNYGTEESPEYEDLCVRIFVDASLIEVYANDRFALSSRVYPSLDTALGISYDFRNEGEAVSTEKVELTCWEGLANACPNRRETAETADSAKAQSKHVEIATDKVQVSFHAEHANMLDTVQ